MLNLLLHRRVSEPFTDDPHDPGIELLSQLKSTSDTKADDNECTLTLVVNSVSHPNWDNCKRLISIKMHCRACCVRGLVFVLPYHGLITLAFLAKPRSYDANVNVNN